MSFLEKLRARFPLQSTRVTVVLDNARAHCTSGARHLAENLNLELMFMPPYTPEFNCIEALWSVIKRDFKRRVLMEDQVDIGEIRFRNLLLDSLNAIKKSVQKKAARSNNRGFMYLVLGKVLQQQRDFVEAELSEINDSMQSLDSVDEEIKQMEQVLLDKPPTEMVSDAEVVAAFSPLQQNEQNLPDQQVFFIDTEHFQASRPVIRDKRDLNLFPEDDVLW